MITEKQKIVAVFSAFHDGYIIFDNEANAIQTWRVDCEYLAEQLNQEDKNFWIKIYECTVLQFNPWMNEKEAEKETWIDKRVIFQTELDILSAREKEGRIVVRCSQDDSQFNYCGGELIVDCKGIEVFDQRWNIVEYDKLKIINNKYWRKLDSQK